MNCLLQRREISRCLKKNNILTPIFFEFKRFTDGMLLKTNKQNKLLSHLVF